LHNRRASLVLLAVSFGFLSTLPFSSHGAWAQDTTIFIDLPNVTVQQGEIVELPIWIANYTYPIAGYSLMFTLDRPGLVSFDSVVVADQTGTLSEGWEYFAPTMISSEGARVTSVADLNVDGSPPPIPPLTLGETLVTLRARVYCDPDTFSGSLVRVIPSGLAEFSDPEGKLILPVSASGGEIRIISGVFGDLDASGAIDIVDVILVINCAFRNDCPPCGSEETDLNCDGGTSILDVVTAVNHVFRAGPPPSC
jgi:hypothetical protein